MHVSPIEYVHISSVHTAFCKFQDRNQPEVTDKYFHDVPFDAHFASELSEFHLVSSMPGVDGFTMKVDALYKVCCMRCTAPQTKICVADSPRYFVLYRL